MTELSYFIDTADMLHVADKAVGRVKPLTGRDRHPGVTFTPVRYDTATGASIWGDPVAIPDVSRWTDETYPKVSPVMVAAILDLTSEAKWLKQARATLGLSQAHLGRIIDTNPRTIRQWEAENGTNERGLNPIARRVVEWMMDGTLDAKALLTRYSRP